MNVIQESSSRTGLSKRFPIITSRSNCPEIYRGTQHNLGAESTSLEQGTKFLLGVWTFNFSVSPQNVVDNDNLVRKTSSSCDSRVLLWNLEWIAKCFGFPKIHFGTKKLETLL